MSFCAQIAKKAEKMSETPLAVQFARFLLGALLMTFGSWLLTLAGIGLMLWSGRTLYTLAAAAACCLVSVHRAEARGEKTEPCINFAALV